MEAETRVAADRDEDDGRELILDRYRLTKQLGSGGFGTVCSARDERLERDVAIKLLPRERVVEARFEREARAAARLQHPGIVTLYEAAVDDDGAYLVSELVRGKPLDRLLLDGKLSDREILEVVCSLCDALEHAHASGVIHRDVKPSNVLVPTAKAHPAKLTDFGVARLIGSDTVTRTGDVIGTLAYMAPEQAEGREAGPAADLYSLAVVAYEALTGANPLRDRSRARRYYRTHLPPLRRQRRDLPRGLGAALDRALQPRESERGTLADLRVAVAAALPHAGEERGIVTDWRVAQTELDDRPADRPDGPGRGLAPRAARDDDVGAARHNRRGGSAATTAHPRRGTVAFLASAAALALGAVALGAVSLAPGGVSLAGAWPVIVGRSVHGLLRRAIVGGGGLLWLAVAGAVSRHDLYLRPGALSAAPANLFAAALVWAAAAALLPVLLPLRPRYPRLELVLAVVGSALVVAGVEAVGAGRAGQIHQATAGAVLGGAIAAGPALAALVKDLRRKAGERPAVS